MVTSSDTSQNARTQQLKNDIAALMREVKAKIETAALFDGTIAGELCAAAEQHMTEIRSAVGLSDPSTAEDGTKGAPDIHRRLYEQFGDPRSANAAPRPEGASSNGRMKPLSPMPARIVEFLETEDTPDNGLRLEDIITLLREADWPDVTEGNVGVTLHRMVADGVLVRPMRGHYAVNKDYIRRKNA